MISRLLALTFLALLAACGGGGGGEDVVVEEPGNVGAGWVTIESPQPPAYTTDSIYGVLLSGEAFISPTWYRCCSGSATDTGVTVTWSNAATGESGPATQRLTYFCPFGICYPGTHTWSAAIDLAVGDNLITVTATDPSGNLGRARITVTRTPDIVPPMVSATTPANDATGVSTNSPLRIAFSEPMAPETLNPETVLLQDSSGGAIGGAVSYADRVATFTPAAWLDSTKRYTATVTTGARDEAGNSLAAAYVWSFTTGTAPDVVPPTVTSVSPANGETCVPTEASVSAIFSEPMLAQSLTSNTFLLKDALNDWVGGFVELDPTANSSRLTPAWPLANAATYTATLTTGVTDLAGNPLPAERSWSFTTQPAGSGVWNTMSEAPLALWGHTAVWTGNRMIVWDGSDVAGAIYDPSADAWSPITNSGAPGFRYTHVAVWTGSEMIVWGGIGIGSQPLSDGARYDPISDTWTPMSSSGAPAGHSSAVWTGTEMIVWGGDASNSARYDPLSDTWTPIAVPGAPSPRTAASAVWTGSEMIVWGGAAPLPVGDGARYNPSTDTWSPIAASDAAAARWRHTAVWTGSEMIVWGGLGSDGPLGDGARYAPSTNTWTPTARQCAPLARYDHVGVWTGTEMLIWGGSPDGGSKIYIVGGRYRPATDTWQAIPTIGVPDARMGHTAIWDGDGMIIWGGYAPFRVFSDGGRYQPQ